MDIVTKEQKIEAIKEIIKARYINTILIVTLGLVLKIKYFTGEWASNFEYLQILIMGLFAFGYNSAYWFYIQKPIKKINDWSLNIVAALQVIVDQIMYTLIYYYTGTIESVAFVLYFLTILIASTLYRTGGIILTALLAVFLHNGLLIIELLGKVAHLTAYPGTVWFGNVFVVRGKIIGFTFYMAAAVVFSIILSGLFRKREKILREQRDELSLKTQELIKTTQELQEAKTGLETKLKEKTERLKRISQDLEEKVKERTKELQLKIDELEKFRRLTIGREIKMIELKKEIEKLKKSKNKN